VNSPENKEKPVLNPECLRFDLHTSEKKSIHIATWFRYTKQNGRFLEIVIEDQAVIRKILVSMDLWEKPARPPPKSLLLELDEYEIAS